MEVKKILQTVNRLLKLDLSDSLFNKTALDNELTSELNYGSTLSKLVDCANLVIDDLATKFYPIKDTLWYVSVDNIIPYAVFSGQLHEVVKITIDNEHIDFTNCEQGVKCGCNGKMEITYLRRPAPIDFLSNVFVGSPKITTFTLAYGVCAEYCLLEGLYDDMSIWDNLYKVSLSAVSVDCREKKLPCRRWF
ncbi:MAG: hypothetical protein RRY18_06280 [Clostridia bacterium]